MAKKGKKRSRTSRRPQAEDWTGIDSKTKREMVAILLFVLALLSVLAFFDLAGPLGRGLDSLLAALLGINKFLIPIILLLIAGRLFAPDRFEMRGWAKFGLGLFLISWGGFINLARFQTVEQITLLENVSGGGGYLGLILAYPLLLVAGFWAAVIILSGLLLVSLVLMFNVSLHDLAVRLAGARHRRWPWPLGHRRRKPEDEEALAGDEEGEAEEENPDFSQKGLGGVGGDKSAAGALTTSKRKRRPKSAMPLDLLNDQEYRPSAGDIHGRMLVIKKTLENFGIPVEMGDVSVGPTVTQFTFKPADGIKLSRITSLSNDLALALAAHPIRIEAPIPGKPLVGIEVPNQAVAIVGLREVLGSKQFKSRRSDLTICLGKDVAGRPWIADLGKMPHLLVAGATGSGKTVCLNSIILSLIYQCGPDDIKLMLIDPKRVELPVYNGIPHLLTPAITEVPKIINALKWSLGEMDRRFELLSQAQKRDIDAYNVAAEEKLPYIVIIIDELADLMVASASEVEASIIRLAQMARAVGIHLVVATQRPSVDVITGLIKANIINRIAFSVASSTDSRTILDCPGAEKLVGRGDMLFQTPELSKPKRIQCCYVSDHDIRQVVDFVLGETEEPAEYVDEVTERQSGSSFSGGGFELDDDVDPLLEEAKMTVLKAGKASASYLQRRLKVGYARAARLLDLLEERGIIGPGDGAKPRQILVSVLDDEDGQHVIGPDEEEEYDDDEEEEDEE